MSKIVFILGAGASQHTGAPLMREFMRKIGYIRESRNIQCIQEDYDLIMKAFDELNPKRSKIKMDYENDIELLFGSFEMAKLVGSLGNLSDIEVTNLPDSMRRVICHTIDNNITISLNGNGDLLNFDQYTIFTQILKRLIDEKGIMPTIITFNYDICLDLLLQAHDVLINYGLPNSTNNGLPLLKLHGSLNWQYSTNLSNPINIIPPPVILADIRKSYQNPQPINLLERYFIKEGKWIDIPFIVPPTWNKTNYHRVIDSVWKKALIELSDVRHLFIIGYSCPDTDLFFKHLLALGMTSAILDTFIVINTSMDPLERIQKMAGDSIRGLVQHSPGGGFTNMSLNQIQGILLPQK